jgi:cis-3-alkyl-4-acyloxetan-2-one decarboxylase
MSLDARQFPDYPFEARRTEVRPGIAMSYLDEGPRDGEVVVMLHGNPSWSYYWRHLVLGLRDRYRCIVPDHVGMGLSDKPDDAADASPRYDYTLASRIEDLDALLNGLGISGPVTLAVHDWGGMIGMGWALRDPGNLQRVRRLVLLNTATFPLPAGKPLPAALRFGRDSALAALLIRASMPSPRHRAHRRGAADAGRRAPRLPRALRQLGPPHRDPALRPGHPAGRG